MCSIKSSKKKALHIQLFRITPTLKKNPGSAPDNYHVHIFINNVISDLMTCKY